MKPRTAILFAALLALGAKLYCAATTSGTNDADSFYNFGRFIWEHGLIAQYQAMKSSRADSAGDDRAMSGDSSGDS